MVIIIIIVVTRKRKKVQFIKDNADGTWNDKCHYKYQLKEDNIYEELPHGTIANPLYAAEDEIYENPMHLVS